MMAKTITVHDFMANLAHPLKAEIEAVRAIILAADANITECIKWNAPSFYFKDDFATFKLRPAETIQVVLHTGAKVKTEANVLKINDPAGLLKWASKDRCVATFSDMKDIETKKEAFTAIITQWIKQIA
ncbi:MAG: DUF1801 domain-containing protein [Methylotenera sp.]